MSASTSRPTTWSTTWSDWSAPESRGPYQLPDPDRQGHHGRGGRSPRSVTVTRSGSAASPVPATPRPCRVRWPRGSVRHTSAVRTSRSGSGRGPRRRPRSTGCWPRSTGSTRLPYLRPTAAGPDQRRARSTTSTPTSATPPSRCGSASSATSTWRSSRSTAILPTGCWCRALGRQQQDLARAGRPRHPRGEQLAASRLGGLPRHLLRHRAAAAPVARSSSPTP